MNKPRAVLATSAVFLSAALVASYFQSQEPAINATDVLTWDCESAEYKPESITLTCADGGWSIQGITWSTWTEKGADGTGTWKENLCKPNCAEGKIAEAKVNIKLSDLTSNKGKFYLRTVDISTTDGEDFPWGRSGIIKWDVMEFIENMKG
jgi:hypothetical protein